VNSDRNENKKQMGQQASLELSTDNRPAVAKHGALLQRKCDCGNHSITGSCNDCAKKKGLLQRKTAPGIESSAAPPVVNEVLRSPGQTLDPATHAFREPRFAHDFSQVKAFPGEKQLAPSVVMRLETEALGAQPLAVAEKSVISRMNNSGIAAIENGPDAGAPGPKPPGGAPAPAPAPKKKKAGVDSFVVKWKKHDNASATNARHRLDFTVKFKKDADHDPSAAEFRQNAGNKWEVTDGPHKGQKKTTPIRDDNYSRADDTAGHTKADVDFVSEDNPGLPSIDKDDVIDYSFTAEQMIIDTNDGDKEIAKKGPHTATIKGKDPRVYADVPKTL
jgi:hypothetical protein